MSEELKPCPFCGKSAIISKVQCSRGRTEEWDEYQPSCTSEITERCPGTGHRGYLLMEEAISAWNTRAGLNEHDICPGAFFTISDDIFNPVYVVCSICKLRPSEHY